jgi:hypothetical protein
MSKEFYSEFVGHFYPTLIKKEFTMLQIFFGSYLVLGLPVIGLLLAVLAASSLKDREETNDRPRASVRALTIPHSNRG